MKGFVYKLYSENPECDKCYIGSTKSKYVSIRMAHHREHNRKGKDYQGIFDDNGNAKICVLEELEFENMCDLRKRELYHLQENKDKAINIRLPYIAPEEQIKKRDAAIKRYHQSEKGQLALRIANLNHQIKKAESISDNPVKIKTLKDKLQQAREKQKKCRDSDNSPEEKQIAKIETKLVVDFP